MWPILKRQLRETNYKITQILELTDKNLKAATISMLKMIKENVYTCNKWTNRKFQQEIKNIKSQVKIPKLKNSLSKVKKNHWMGLTNQNRESIDNQKKLFKINRKKWLKNSCWTPLSSLTYMYLESQERKRNRKNIWRIKSQKIPKSGGRHKFTN